MEADRRRHSQCISPTKFLELRAQRGRSAQGSRPSFPSRTEVTSAAGARRIRSRTLTIDAGIAARPALLAEGGYELPELLRWFERRPQLAAALIWGDTSQRDCRHRSCGGLLIALALR